MKNILLLTALPFLFLTSCGLFQPSPKLSETSEITPGWLYSPYVACNAQSELCATGEGKNYSESDSAARANLASIFEVKVKSEFSSHISSSQSFSWSGEVRQEVQESLQESVDQILEGVQIKNHFKSKDLTYSLAALDRNKASEIVGARLNKIDDELNALWSKKSRTNLRRIVRLYLEREKINERYSILSGSPKAARMTYKDIVEWRQSRAKVEALILKIGQAPEWMTEKLKELLTESGFRLVKGDANKVVSLNVDSIKEFLNVEGYEKYTFSMNLTSFENGEKKKVLAVSETVTGRTQADALLKVKQFFIDYIEQHLSDLDLD